MTSSERRISSSGSGRSSQSRSRPWGTLRASPASARTRRCFVTACRVTSVPAVSRVIESGPSAPSRATRRRRVWSPSAAKTGSVAVNAAAVARALPPLAKESLDVLCLFCPAFRVHAESLRATRQGDAVEARLHDSQLGAPGHVGELALDERRGLARVVVLRVDGVGVPAPREEPLALHA